MTTEQLTAISLPEEDVPSCQHHWVLRDDGPVSVGECRLCGGSKEFKNSLETSYWGSDDRSNRPAKETRVTLLGRPSRSRIMNEEDED